jgi:hypothetical protein
MKDKEKIELLTRAFNETIWMAIRYAHGRSTYAPSMVRDAIKDFQKVHPDWEPKHDSTVTPPSEEETKSGFFRMKEDYLHDLFKQNEMV